MIDIKEFRHKHNLSVEDIGKITGVSPNTVRSWEGITNPRKPSKGALYLLDNYQKQIYNRGNEEKNMDFFSRLDTYMEYKGLNDNRLTVEAGISNGLIGKARNRGSLSQDNISKILYKYSDLDANWLLTGKGSMLSEDLEYKNNNASTNTKPSSNSFDKFDKKMENINDRLTMLYSRVKLDDNEFKFLQKKLNELEEKQTKMFDVQLEILNILKEKSLTPL